MGGMDLEFALAAEKAINDLECNGSLDAISALSDPVERDALLTALVPVYASRSANVRALIRDIFAQHESSAGAPTPPAGYRTLWTEKFADLSNWDVYGPGNKETWGQQAPQNRSGFYGYAGLNAGPKGLDMTVTPDPAGRQAKSGRPGWSTQFIVPKPTLPCPLYARYEVEGRFDRLPGFWPALLWMTLNPGGSDVVELDVHEWFGNDPTSVRQATHMRRNGTASVDYNVGPAILGLNQRTPIRDDGSHRYAVTVHPDGAGHVRFAYEFDGHATYGFSTRDLAAKGSPHDDWVKTALGWSLKICTQAEGQSGFFPAGFKGPASLHVNWVQVSVPT